MRELGPIFRSTCTGDKNALNTSIGLSRVSSTALAYFSNNTRRTTRATLNANHQISKPPWICSAHHATDPARAFNWHAFIHRRLAESGMSTIIRIIAKYDARFINVVDVVHYLGFKLQPIIEKQPRFNVAFVICCADFVITRKKTMHRISEHIQIYDNVHTWRKDKYIYNYKHDLITACMNRVMHISTENKKVAECIHMQGCIQSLLISRQFGKQNRKSHQSFQRPKLRITLCNYTITRQPSCQ